MPDSPYRKAVNAAILKLGESGKLNELKRKWWSEKLGGGKCSSMPKEEGDSAELGVDNVGGVFLVLVVGLVMAVLIGLLEFIWNVKDVALEEKISLKEAFIMEIMFVAKFWITSKPVHGSSGGSGSDSKSTKSSKSGKSIKSEKSSRSDLNLKPKSKSREQSDSRSPTPNKMLKNVSESFSGLRFLKRGSEKNNVESPL